MKNLFLVLVLYKAYGLLILERTFLISLANCSCVKYSSYGQEKTIEFIYFID